MQFRCLLLLLSVAVVGFTPAPFPRPGKKKVDDQQAIRGTWKVRLYESNGAPLPTNYQVKIEKGRWSFFNETPNGTTPSSSYEFHIDPGVKPAAFDWRFINNPRPSWHGSYRIDGRKLTIVFTTAGAARPTDFMARNGYKMELEKISP
jgi:uncharacterized protein (TIGR03067 family)